MTIDTQTPTPQPGTCERWVLERIGSDDISHKFYRELTAFAREHDAALAALQHEKLRLRHWLSKIHMANTVDPKNLPVEMRAGETASMCIAALNGEPDSFAAITRQRDELLTALHPIADTKTRNESLMVLVLTDDMIFAARAAIANMHGEAVQG